MKNLKALVNIQSDKDSSEIINYLKNKFEPVAKELLIVKNQQDTNKSLIVGINCKLKNISPIVLAGHIDTVSPDTEQYTTNPYELTIKNGKGYGLGSIDMKSFTAIILDQFEVLKAFKQPIVVALTSDEETNLKCIENVIETFKELNIKPKMTIVGEPTNSKFCTCSNGCYEYQVEVFGKSCHSSTPQNGVNSIYVISKLITFIEQTQKDFQLTSNCAIVSGGDIINRVPSYATLKFDIRSTSSQQVELFLNKIKEKIENLKKEYFCSISIKKELEIPPLSDKGNALISTFAKDNNIEITKFSGGCEAGYFQKYSGDAVVFGVGDLSLAHKPNEYVVLNEYNQYSSLLTKFVQFIEKSLYF